MQTRIINDENTLADMLVTFTNAETTETSGAIIHSGFHAVIGKNIILLALNNGEGVLITE